MAEELRQKQEQHQKTIHALMTSEIQSPPPQIPQDAGTIQEISVVPEAQNLFLNPELEKMMSSVGDQQPPLSTDQASTSPIEIPSLLVPGTPSLEDSNCLLPGPRVRREIFPAEWVDGLPALTDRLISMYFANPEVIRQILVELSGRSPYVFVPITDWAQLLGNNEYPYRFMSDLLTDREWVRHNLYTSMVIAKDGIYNDKWAQMLLVAKAYFQSAYDYAVKATVG